jgi:MFS family permease
MDSSHWLSALLAAVSSFSFGYQLGAPDASSSALSACPPTDPLCVPSIDTGSAAWGVAVGQMCVGAFLGCLMFGRLADMIGRKRSIMVVNVFYGLGCALTVASRTSLVLFGVGRAVIGVGVGGSCVAVPVYLGEVASLEWRGVVGSFHQMAIVLGYLTIQLLALTVKPLGSWHLLYYVNAAIVLIHSLLFGAFAVDYRKSDRIQSSTDSPDQQRLSIPQVTRSTLARRSLVVACLLHLVQQLSGINGVFSYAGELFKEDWWAPLALAVLNVLMTVVSIWLMDRAGRRPLLLGSVFTCVLSLLAATVAGALEYTTIASIAVLSYVAGFAVGLGPVPWLMMSELFPPASVAAAVSLAVSVNWLSNFAVTGGFPVVAGVLGVYKFVPSVVVLGVFWVWAWRELPETSGRPSEYL